MGVSSTLSWANIGPWGLIGITVSLIVLGFLVPRRTVKDLVDAPKEAARNWREAHNLLLSKLEVLLEQNRALIESAKIQEQLLRSLPRPPGGDAGVVSPQRGETS